MKLLPLLSLLILLAAPQDEARIRLLLERLDDDSIDVRAESAAALAKIGAAAVPAVQAALEGATGEFRERLLETLRRIRDRERLAALLPDPSLISLEAERRPLRDVLKRLSRQTRTPLDFSAVPEHETVSVSLQGVPFWKALEHVCRINGHVMPQVEGDRVLVLSEPYVALPGKISDRFRVTLETVELSSDGTFGQQDHYERLTATFQVAWEKGVRPFRVCARLMEILDENGKEVVTDLDEDSVLSSSSPPESLRHRVALASDRGPGAQATKLGRLKAAIELEFPLKSATVAFDLAPGKLPATSECPEFSATLVEFRKSEGVVSATISFVVRPPLEGVIASEAIFLRDKDGQEHVAAAQSTSTSEYGTVYQVFFPGVQEQSTFTQIVIRVPSEVHRERVEIELPNLPLK